MVALAVELMFKVAYVPITSVPKCTKAAYSLLHPYYLGSSICTMSVVLGFSVIVKDITAVFRDPIEPDRENDKSGKVFAVVPVIGTVQ